jgi:hypothetical protein
MRSETVVCVGPGFESRRQRSVDFILKDSGKVMSLDQTTIAGVAAFATGGVLFLLHLKRVKAERAQQRRQALAAVRAGQLPAVPAPPAMKLAASEIVHICAKVTKGERTDAKQDLGDGLFVATSRRICFFGKRKASLTWKKIEIAGMGPDGNVVARANDGRAYAFTLGRSEDAELTAAILVVLDDMRARSAAKAAAAAAAKTRNAVPVESVEPTEQ